MQGCDAARKLLSPQFASRFLHSICGLLPVAGASYYAVDGDGVPFGHYLRDIPTSHLRSYEMTYRAVDPLHPCWHRDSAADIVRLSQARQRGDPIRYEHGFLRTVGFHDEVELFFRDPTGGILLGVGLMRADRDGPFDDFDLELLRRAKPILDLALHERVNAPHPDREERTPAANDPLTGRERQIVELVRHGASNRDIAARLDLSVATVKTHLFNIFKKTGAKSRTALLNLVPPALSQP